MSVAAVPASAEKNYLHSIKKLFLGLSIFLTLVSETNRLGSHFNPSICFCTALRQSIFKPFLLFCIVCRNVNKSLFVTFATGHIGLNQQRDQIWRIFPTLGKFNKSLTRVLEFILYILNLLSEFLYWQIFLVLNGQVGLKK